jgi:hypothetical protein
MTICAAALAAKSKAIVCVADKAMSFGDVISWDSDVTKIVPLSHPGCVAMMSGPEEGTSRVLSALLAIADLGSTVEEIKKTCEREYGECVQELIEQKFLKPRLLTKELYKTATTGAEVNSAIEALSSEIKGYSIGCDFIVCGFDSKKSPFILDLSLPDGTATDMTSVGFAAIGSGHEYTLARLLFLTHRRDDDLDKSLYDVFDAKASAEMSPTVGTDWDSVVVYCGGDGTAKVEFVDDDINDLIERVWFHKAALSPYEKREAGQPTKPPRAWKSKLKKYADKLLSPEKPSDSSQGKALSKGKIVAPREEQT